MAGFRALAQQVRDPDREPSQRRQALRKCLERFAPYGHRATWQHLCRNAGFHPEDREPDPALLMAALEELEEARAVWLAYEEEVRARRRREKRKGIRQPTELDEWHRLSWGGRSLMPCDPAQPPTPRLAEVLRRMIAVEEREPGAADRAAAARVPAGVPHSRACPEQRAEPAHSAARRGTEPSRSEKRAEKRAEARRAEAQRSENKRTESTRSDPKRAESRNGRRAMGSSRLGFGTTIIPSQG